MYHTFSSGGLRDNSSVYSGSSNTTSGSAFHSRGIPRSNSTSDLFEIPVQGTGGNCRKPKSGPRASFAANGRSNSLQHVPKGHQLPNGYQIKPRDMHYHRGRFPDQQSLRQGLCKSPSYSSSNYSLEPQNSLNSIPERRQPHYVLTPYQLQRKQMKGAFQFPNGENFTPRNKLPRSSSSIALSKGGNPALQPLSRSQSMNSLPPRPVRLPKPPLTVVTSPSPVESGSSGSSYNSMKDHSSSGSTNQSSRPSTHSSYTNLPSTVGKQRSPLVMKIEPPRDKENLPEMIVEEVPTSTGSQTETNGPVKRKNSNTPNDGKETSNKSVKRGSSMSGFKSFLKKLFHRQSSSRSPSPISESDKNKKRQRITRELTGLSADLPNELAAANSSMDNVDEETNRTPVSKTEAENDSSAEDEDDGDDTLMDTDLVFDSLLLKADSNRVSCLQKQIELNQKLQKIPSLDSRIPSDLQSPPEASKEESNIDYELISEFSRLGKFIEKAEEIRESKPSNLPTRSPKRPAISSKDSARSFYHPRRRGTGSSHDLIARLYQDWKIVHLDASVQTQKHFLKDKELRFGQDIYVNDTWSATDYERSDKRFIRNRRRLMQLKDKGFIEAVKIELNEFKKNEMKVHMESTQFTHFFS